MSSLNSISGVWLELRSQHGIVTGLVVNHVGINGTQYGSRINRIGGSKDGIVTNLNPVIVHFVFRHVPNSFLSQRGTDIPKTSRSSDRHEWLDKPVL
jgi:hypothetical protein